MSEDTNPPKSNIIPFAVPDLGIDDLLNDEPDMDDLAFIARLFMQRTISKMDWSGFKAMAETMVDESDAATIVKLMENAQVEVIVGGA